MENEDLIKKLENIDLPEIEIKDHKRKLRAVLLNSDYFRKPNPWEVFKKRFVFVFPGLALLVIFGALIVRPKLTEAQALGIAKNNPDVLKLMQERGITLNEVKIKDGMAYVLMGLLEDESLREKAVPIGIQKTKNETKNAEEIEGVVVEINLGQKKVSEIKTIKVDEISLLDSEQEQNARKIVEEEEIIKEIIPEDATIEEIKSALPRKLNLIEKNEKIEVMADPSAQKRAWVHYTVEGKEWKIQVNLDKKKVEGMEIYSEDEAEEED